MWLRVRLVKQQFANVETYVIHAPLAPLFRPYLFSGIPLLSYKYIILGGKQSIHNLHWILLNSKYPLKEGAKGVRPWIEGHPLI